MAEDPDLERRLTAMFDSLRPRAEFEAELRGRLGRRWWRGLLPAGVSGPGLNRLAPVLAVLLVTIGAIAFLLVRHPGGGSGAESYSSAPAISSTAFGVLPPPAGSIGARADQQAGAAVTAPIRPGAVGRFTFSGVMPALPATAPVYRYDEPSAARRDGLARELGARTGLAITIGPSHFDSGTPATFSASAGVAQAGGAPAGEVASAIVQKYRLTPTYQTQRIEGDGVVIYAWQIRGGGQPALLVDRLGSPIGLQVSLGAPVRISGPLELPLTASAYPLRSPAEAASSVALSAPQPGLAGGVLDHAELVYVVTGSGEHGYLEPAILFSGPAGRVIGPAVAPSFLHP